MPIATTRQVTLPVEGDTLTVRYRPGVLTVAALQESPPETPEAITAFLVRLLVSWDLLNEEGVPLPVSEESILSVPFWLLQEIIQALLRDFLAYHQQTHRRRF